jgi:hypothetical protein
MTNKNHSYSALPMAAVGGAYVILYFNNVIADSLSALNKYPPNKNAHYFWIVLDCS